MEPITLRDLIGVPIHRVSWGMTMSTEEVGEGHFAGIANVMGVIDSFRSVWMPGCYSARVVKEFRDDHGFFSDGHGWKTGDAVATADRCEAIGNVLEVEGEWHTTDIAERVRKVCLERAARKKKTGMSVSCGLDWNKIVDFRNGEKFWAWAASESYDMSLLDPAIRQDENWLWAIPSVDYLAEVAITQVPAVPGSQMTEIRSAYNVLRDGSLAGLPLKDHLDSALAAAAGALGRAKETSAKRALDDRTLGKERRAQLRELGAALLELADIPCATNPDATREQARRLRLRTEAGL